jgi:Flp pilus assembly protein TadD
VDKSATLHHFLGINYAKAGRLREAVLSAERAVKLARDAGEEDLAQQIGRQVQRYRRDLEAKPK